MELVLDTNVLANPRFLEWLRTSKRAAVLPAIAYMEAFYHTLKRQRSPDTLREALTAAGIKVHPMTADQAEQAASGAIGRWDFAEKARDYAIGALAKSLGATMVTENKRDFSRLADVKTPREVMGEVPEPRSPSEGKRRTHPEKPRPER